MDFVVLQLYEQDFLLGRMSADAVVEQLQGVKLPQQFPSLHPSFLALFYPSVGKTFCSLQRNDVHVRAEEEKDRDITHSFLTHFEEEVLVRDFYKKKEGFCFVLETAEDILVAALWYSFDTRKKQGMELFIHRLYVEPLYRERSYGTFLVEESIARAGSCCSLVSLLAPESVVPFYKKLGFVCKKSFMDVRLGKNFFYFSKNLKSPAAIEDRSEAAKNSLLQLLFTRMDYKKYVIKKNMHR